MEMKRFFRFTSLLTCLDHRCTSNTSDPGLIRISTGLSLSIPLSTPAERRGRLGREAVRHQPWSEDGPKKVLLLFVNFICLLNYLILGLISYMDAHCGFTQNSLSDFSQ